MTRVKRIVTTTCAASFLLGWTGISNMQLLIPFRSAGASVLLASKTTQRLPIIRDTNSEGRMPSMVRTATIVTREMTLHNGIRSLEGVMKTATRAGRETMEPTTSHATTDCMTGHATKTSTADQAMTNPTAVPAR